MIWQMNIIETFHELVAMQLLVASTSPGAFSLTSGMFKTQNKFKSNH